MGETAASTKLTVVGKATPADVREEAFRLWVAYGRSARRVAERLQCAERTVHNWRVEDRWEERRQQEAAAFLPGATVEGAIALRLAAHNAAVRLQQITYDNLEHGVPIDEKEVKALTSIVAVGGYNPTAAGKAQPTDVHTANLARPTGIDVSDLAGRSPDELTQLEREYRAKRRSG